MLDVDSVHTYYGDSHVLHGVSLHVAAGEAVAVLGRNGVGKTTLIRTIVGFTPARAGAVRLEGRDITRLPPHRIARLGVGLVPQGRRIFAPLTVHENLVLGLRRRAPTRPADLPAVRTGDPSRVADPPAVRTGDPSRVADPLARRSRAPTASAHPRFEPGSQSSLQKVFELFPRLRERAHQGGGTLSGGEQEMLAIARALMTDARLLLLDEPSEGLAPLVVREIGRTFLRLKSEGMSILIVEQHVPLALRVADRVYVISKGQIVYHGTPAALDADEDVKRRYLGIA